MKRITADIFLVGLALLVPWWVALLAAVGFFFVFADFYELIAVGLLLDLLYGAPMPRLHDFQFALALLALFLFALLRSLKRRMRIAR